MQGETYGFELAPSWQVTDWWRLRPSYSLLQMHLRRDAGSTDRSMSAAADGNSPQQQAALGSSMDFPGHISLDANFRCVDRLPNLQVSSYVALDVRLGWRPTPELEFALVAQNLLSNHHAEFAPTLLGTQRTEIPWGFYAQFTWRFGAKQ
jgi:iron complex outermembrane receptor protein